MSKYNIRERIPDRQDISERIPDKDAITNRLPDEETRLKAKIYTKLLAVVLALSIGMALALSGVVLIPMMAFSYEVLAVIGAAGMVSFGAVLSAGAYLWLTGPA